jgi:hypothetical protein
MIKLILFFIIINISLLAENDSKSIIRVQVENDFLSDKYYTNGLKFDYHNNSLPSPIKFGAKKIYSLFTNLNCTDCTKETTGYSITQAMYSPYYLSDYNPPYKDRPYAGVGSIGNSHSIAIGNWVHHTELKAGKIGMDSGAEASQKFIHKTFQFSSPQGWNNQIPDSSFLNWNHKSYYGINNSNGLTAEWAIGNLNTSVGMGFTFRQGLINSPISFIGASILNGSAPPLFTKEEDDEEEFYWYITPSIKYQLYDGTLQTNQFSKAHKANIDLNSFVFPGNLRLSDSTIDTNRFFFYKYIYDPKSLNSDIENHLIYNTLFNNGRYVSIQSYNIIYYTANFGNMKAESQLLLLYNLGVLKADYSIMQLLAAREFLKTINPGKQEEQTATLALMVVSGMFDTHKAYTQIPRNWQGKLEFGGTYTSQRYFVGVSLTLSQLDFYANSQAGSFHYWFNIQLGEKF